MAGLVCTTDSWLEKRMTMLDENTAMVLFLLFARAAHAQHTFAEGGCVHLDRSLT